MDIVTYAICRKAAAGAVSGVSSMSVNAQTLTINCTNGQVLKMNFPVPKDGVSVTDIDVDLTKRIVFTMSDGTTFVSDTPIPTVQGDPGFSPIATVSRNIADDGVVITITDQNGTTRANVYDGTVATVISYNSLTDKPTLNGVVISGSRTTDDYNIDIPTAVSDLDNDTGFITAADIPTVDSTLSTLSTNAVQNATVTTEIRSTQSDVTALQTTVTTNTADIAVLNGDATTTGSVQKQIHDAISAQSQMSKQVVTTLPEVADAEENVIYMVLDPDAVNTTYLMYMKLLDSHGDYVLAQTGSTETDLSDYPTFTDMNTALTAKENTISLATGRAVVSDANGKLSASTITSSEIEALDDITGNIQTQLNAKQGTLTFDTAPVNNSANPVTSGGVYTALSAKQDTLTFDNAPTESSLAPVTSGGIYTALQGKQDTLTFDSSPHESSTNPVTSGGVYTALQNVTVDIATTETVGTVKPDGTTITIDNEGTISGAPSYPTFKGTVAEWEALTPTERLEYEAADIYGDLGSLVTVTDTVASGDLNPVTSNAVYTAVSSKQDVITPDTSPVINSSNLVTSGGVYTADAALGTRIDTVTSKLAKRVTIWSGTATKGTTGMNFDATPYDIVKAILGGLEVTLTAGVRTNADVRKKFTAVYSGRDNTSNPTYIQHYILDILGNGTVATCGWFDINSLNIQNARLAGQRALQGGTWSDPAWKTLADVETSLNCTLIIGYTFDRS